MSYIEIWVIPYGTVLRPNVNIKMLKLFYCLPVLNSVKLKWIVSGPLYYTEW